MENAKNYGRYAIIANGGKQYQVVEGKTVALELITGNPGDAGTCIFTGEPSRQRVIFAKSY